jgi:hypothetical protein
MAIDNWQYDNLKSTLKTLIEAEDTPNKDILFQCFHHFERYDLWMKRLQEALWYEENERKHTQRKLKKIEDIIKRDTNND